MARRRTVLVGFAGTSLSFGTGCLDTLSGGRFSGGVDQTQLTAQKGEIVDRYADAIEDRNQGITARDDAVRAFNDESYDEAIDTFETAMEHFESAKQGFADAAALAVETGEEDVAAICETAEEDAELQISATEAALNAAEAADSGEDPAEVNGHVEEYRDLLEQSEQITVEEPQTLVDIIESG